MALADMVGDLDGVFEWAERYFSRPEAEDSYQARPVWACRARVTPRREATPNRQSRMPSARSRGFERPATTRR